MSEEDIPEQIFNDNCYDSNSPSDHQCSSTSTKDLFEDEVKEERNGKNNQPSRPKSKTEFVLSVAVPEKIVICIDTLQDMALGYACTLSNKGPKKASTIMKEALRVFLVNKLAIAKDTLFALVSIAPGNNVQLISNFTSDIKQLLESLSEMNYETTTNVEDMSDYDITPIFSKVFRGIDLPENRSNKVPPEYLVRVIFIYNNSYSIPRLNEDDNYYARFLNSPLCIFDVVYLHEAQSDFNSVVKINEQFSKIISPRSYLLECSRNVTLVFNTFAKLLAHPYQRVSLQGLWEF